MTEKYATINPNSYVENEEKGFSDQGEFAALVRVLKSRYGPRYTETEIQNTGYTQTVAIIWDIEYPTTGNKGQKLWSTGLKWGVDAKPTPDGRRLVGLTPDFKGFKGNSDGLYFLRKVIASGFPDSRLTDDIGVFDNECFFIHTDINPKSKGSSKKAYPKTYHPEGWEKATADTLARRAAKEAQQQGTSSTATLQSSATIPQVVVADHVMQEASTALMNILVNAGKPVARTELPVKINELATQMAKTGKGWDKDLRQGITLALWNIDQLAAIVNNNPSLKMEGETVSFK